MDVTVVIASYGDRGWLDLGTQRAAVSAFAQGCPVIYVHGLTLHGARNAALEQVQTEFVVHLDADDELEAGYVQALSAGTADLRAPAVRYVSGARAATPYVPKVAGHHHACSADCLRDGNWLVVGAMARTDLLREVGGWRDWPCYEDWDLFQRAWLAGATIEAIPAAVYRAHVNSQSRNRAPAMGLKNAVHHEIVATNLGQVAA